MNENYQNNKWTPIIDTEWRIWPNMGTNVHRVDPTDVSPLPEL